jgi:hypothetical protein
VYSSDKTSIFKSCFYRQKVHSFSGLHAGETVDPSSDAIQKQTNVDSKWELVVIKCVETVECLCPLSSTNRTALSHQSSGQCLRQPNKKLAVSLRSMCWEGGAARHRALPEATVSSYQRSKIILKTTCYCHGNRIFSTVTKISPHWTIY